MLKNYPVNFTSATARIYSTTQISICCPFRRAIFIFLSNTGGRDITQKSYHFWKEGRSRESLVLADFEDLINEGKVIEYAMTSSEKIMTCYLSLFFRSTQ